MPSSPLDIFLVRHGVTDWNEQGRLLGRTDVGLNERGRAQATAVAEALREFPLGAVLASPQRRTQETAELIAQAHGLPVETEPDLAEVWLGRWQGKTFAELGDDPDLQRYIEDPTYGCDAIEPAAAVQKRVVAVVQRLREAGPGKSIALVSHGDPLRLIVAHFLAMELAAYHQLSIAPGSISILRLGRRRHQFLSVNWQPGGLARALSAFGF